MIELLRRPGSGLALQACCSGFWIMTEFLRCLSSGLNLRACCSGFWIMIEVLRRPGIVNESFRGCTCPWHSGQLSVGLCASVSTQSSSSHNFLNLKTFIRLCDMLTGSLSLGDPTLRLLSGLSKAGVSHATRCRKTAQLLDVTMDCGLWSMVLLDNLRLTAGARVVLLDTLRLTAAPLAPAPPAATAAPDADAVASLPAPPALAALALSRRLASIACCCLFSFSSFCASFLAFCWSFASSFCSLIWVSPASHSSKGSGAFTARPE